MRYSCLGDFIGAYARFLVLIFLALGCLGCSSGLAENRKTVILYRGADFGVRYSILLYYLLTTFR